MSESFARNPRRDGPTIGQFGQQDREVRNGASFRVIAKGSDQIQTILSTINHRLSSGSRRRNGPFDALIPLGQVELHDTLLDSVGTVGSANVVDDGYKLSTELTFPGAEDILRASLTGGPLPIESGLKSVIETETEIFQLRHYINSLEGYNAAYSEEPDHENELVITRTGPSKVAETKGSSPIILHSLDIQMEGNPQVGLCLHVESSDLGTLPENHKTLADISEVVVNGYYKIKGLPVPHATLFIAPDPEIISAFEQGNAAFGERERMIFRPEFGVSTDQLDREIDESIVRPIPPDVNFGNIGGSKRAKESLLALGAGLIDPTLFQNEGTTIPRGVLISGPEGTGKTNLALATADLAGATVYDLTFKNLLLGTPGNNEKLLHRVIERTNGINPSVLLLRNFDRLARLDEGLPEYFQLLLENFFQQVEDVTARNPKVVVIGTTDSLGTINPKYLRPKIFGEVLEVPLPGRVDREEIVDIHMAKAMQRAEGREIFAPEIDIIDIAGKTAGFNGEELESVVQRALDQRARRMILGGSTDLLTQDEIVSTIPLVKPPVQQGPYL